MVVISGALCTVEDYVIMSQCAHNKAIKIAAEGTVSVTDISKTQNITIVGLPDYIKKDFKITLYAKETQRYLCFNEHWKLVGMRELQETCYFNETIVHGYFVFRSVVDLQRRVGFTHRGKAIGPKKNVTDACYLFTKIHAEQFFHQHTQHHAAKTKDTTTTTDTSNQSTIESTSSTKAAAAATTTTATSNKSKSSRNRNGNHKNQHRQHSLGQKNNNVTKDNRNHKHHVQPHQVRHHHSDAAIAARRHQHEIKQKQNRHQRNRTRIITSPSQSSSGTEATTTTATTTKRTSKTIGAQINKKLTTVAQKEASNALPTTGDTVTTAIASETSPTNKRKERRRKNERNHRKLQQQINAKDQQQREIYKTFGGLTEVKTAPRAKGTTTTKATTRITLATEDTATSVKEVASSQSRDIPSTASATIATGTTDQSSSVSTDWSSSLDPSLSTPMDYRVSIHDNGPVSSITSVDSSSTFALNLAKNDIDVAATSETYKNTANVLTTAIATATKGKAAGELPTMPSPDAMNTTVTATRYNTWNTATFYDELTTLTEEEADSTLYPNTENRLTPKLMTNLKTFTTDYATNSSELLNELEINNTNSWRGADNNSNMVSSESSEEMLETEMTAQTLTTNGNTNNINVTQISSQHLKMPTWSDRTPPETYFDVVPTLAALSGNKLQTTQNVDYLTKPFTKEVARAKDVAATQASTRSSFDENFAHYIFTTKNSNNNNNNSNIKNHRHNQKSHHEKHHHHHHQHQQQQQQQLHPQQSHNISNNELKSQNDWNNRSRNVYHKSNRRKLLVKASAPTTTPTTFKVVAATQYASNNPLQLLFNDAKKYEQDQLRQQQPHRQHHHHRQQQQEQEQQQQQQQMLVNELNDLKNVHKNVNHNQYNNTLIDYNISRIRANSNTSPFAAITPTPTPTIAAPTAALSFKKYLRKSTQKLMATPFHQLTYVRNDAGDIDIDNIDNISVYSDLVDGDIDANNDGLNGNVRNSGASNDAESRSGSNGNSRMTIVSGYLPTSATATLPESIRIAKIKINKVRKRMLQEHYVGEGRA